MNKIWTFVQKFANDWSINLAGMMTYSLITAIIPLLVGILSIVGLVLKTLSPSEFNTLVTALGSALPTQTRKVIDMTSILKGLVNIAGVAGIVALVGLLWTGSNLFANIENAFSIAYRTRDRDFIPQRLMAIGMIILLAILLPLSLVASGLVNAGAGLFGGLLPGPLKVILTVVGPLTSIGILFLLFLAIYIIVPNITLSFRHAWRGALTAAVLVAIVELIFPIYSNIFLNGNQKYGGVFLSVLVLIIFLWFFNVILMIGAQVNTVAMGLKPLPYDVAHTLADDYERMTQAGQAPPHRRRALAPPRQRVVTTGRATGSLLATSGRVLAWPLRLLALAGWLVARPFMHGRARRGG